MSSLKCDADGWLLPYRELHRIHCAAEQGDLMALEAELNHGTSVELRSNDSTFQRTPLMHAAFYGQLAAMQLLLERKANIEAANSHGYTALHCCYKAKKPECAAFLLDCKTDINQQTLDGETLLLLTAGHGQEALFKLL